MDKSGIQSINNCIPSSPPFPLPLLISVQQLHAASYYLSTDFISFFDINPQQVINSKATHFHGMFLSDFRIKKNKSRYVLSIVSKYLDTFYNCLRKIKFIQIFVMCRQQLFEKIIVIKKTLCRLYQFQGTTMYFRRQIDKKICNVDIHKNTVWTVCLKMSKL